jgi:hypothetical protein
MRMMSAQLIWSLLNGPGPFTIDDPRLHDELTLMLLRYLGVDEGGDR